MGLKTISMRTPGWGVPGLGANLRYLQLPQNLISNQTTLDDFETIGTGSWGMYDTGGSIALDNVDFKTGSNSVKLTTTTPGGSPSISKTVAWNFAYPLTWFWVWFDDPTKISSMAFYAKKGTDYYQYAVPLLSMVSGWNLLDLRKASANWSTHGSPNWSDVTQFVLRIFNKVGQSAVVKFDNLANYAQTPAIMLGFDDGRASQYQYAYPYLLSKRKRATGYAVGTWVAGNADFMDWTQLAQVSSGRFGWDIGNHTNTHPHMTTLSESDQEAQLSTCKATLDAHGLSKASMHMAHPFSEYNADTLTAMTATEMLTGRGGTQYWNLMPFTNPYTIYALDMSSKTVAQWQTAIDDCKTNGYLFGVFAHNLVTSSPAAGEYLVSDWQAVVDYAIAQGLPFLTASDVYALRSDPISILI